MSIVARTCVLVFLLIPTFAQANPEVRGCAPYVAQWLDPDNGERIDGKRLLKRLKKTRIILLGEAHTSIAHHRWQHYMLSALHSRYPRMMVGFEMLPRVAQPVLDDWSAGKIGEKDFLERSNWQKIWGYDADLYLPLFHFVRQHRLPAVALNVERELISRVGEAGWDAIEEAERRGISDPAPASPAYRESLARLYAYKQSLAEDGEAARDPDDTDIEAILKSAQFANFVDAQLTWDRAMAEALAAALWRDPKATVVGIVGRGHLEYGYGIPHQLADLGIDRVDVLLPIDADDDCASLPPDLARAVFVVDADGAPAAPPRPRLGVYIEGTEDGVRVTRVIDDSVADASGIREGDLIQAAAGFDTRSAAELIEIVRRQAPGTWLPLRLLRDGDVIEKIARFPQEFE